MNRRERRNQSGRSSQSKKSNDHKKLALIGVLVVGLIIAVVTMPESEDSDQVTQVAATPVSVSSSTLPAPTLPAPIRSVPSSAGAPPTPGAAEINSDASLTSVSKPHRRWTLDEMFAQRPIRPPAWDANLSRLDTSTPVQAIYQSGNQAKALMRGQVVRRGSVLGRHQHVDSITADGIRVRKTAPR